MDRSLVPAEIPVHHRLLELLDAYLAALGRTETKTVATLPTLFR